MKEPASRLPRLGYFAFVNELLTLTKMSHST
jgi:hypothetical protein